MFPKKDADRILEPLLESANGSASVNAVGRWDVFIGQTVNDHAPELGCRTQGDLAFGIDERHSLNSHQ